MTLSAHCLPHTLPPVGGVCSAAWSAGTGNSALHTKDPVNRLSAGMRRAEHSPQRLVPYWVFGAAFCCSFWCSVLGAAG